MLKREELLTLAQTGQLSKAEPHLPKLLIDAREDGPEICEAFVRGYLDTFRLDRAFELLTEAINNGFGYRAWLENDNSLKALRGDPRFQSLLERLD